MTWCVRHRDPRKILSLLRSTKNVISWAFWECEWVWSSMKNWNPNPCSVKTLFKFLFHTCEYPQAENVCKSGPRLRVPSRNKSSKPLCKDTSIIQGTRKFHRKNYNHIFKVTKLIKGHIHHHERSVGKWLVRKNLKMKLCNKT